MESEAYRNIRQELEVLPVDKWGWVIYRCTYADDEKWARFRDRVEAHSREKIAESDAPEIAERLEWTWVEDRATLDGASTAELRARFRAWVADEVARQPGNYDTDSVARFKYFIKIDEEVLQNVDEFLYSGKGAGLRDFVKLVDADWVSSAGQVPEEDEDKYEPIEGCTEWDIGWMRIGPEMIGASFYDAMNGDSMAWDDKFYSRPPKVVLW